MKPTTSLKIAKTAIQEIRLLLLCGRVAQALEMAEALRNLPLTEANKAQSKDIERGLVSYFNQYPERKNLSHWEFVFPTKQDGQSDNSRLVETE